MMIDNTGHNFKRNQVHPSNKSTIHWRNGDAFQRVRTALLEVPPKLLILVKAETLWEKQGYREFGLSSQVWTLSQSGCLWREAGCSQTIKSVEFKYENRKPRKPKTFLQLENNLKNHFTGFLIFFNQS